MEIKHNNFTKLFERYGWNVEQLSNNSYVADNREYFAAFSIIDKFCCGVSGLCCDKAKLLTKWKLSNANTNVGKTLGYFAYCEWLSCSFNQFGGIGSRNHTVEEIESWLKQVRAEQTQTELSYLDLLSKLNADIKSDLIPDEEKREMLRLVAELKAMLWKYSA